LTLKPGFTNLIDFEFNIQNAVQSDNSAYLTIIATLFLPVSYLASVFGMTTVTWPVKWYLWAAIPLVIASAIFTATLPWAIRHTQKRLYPIESLRIQLQPSNFTMLGDELPASANIPGSQKSGRVKPKAQRPSGPDGGRSRSRPREKVNSDD
jgi:hypothetical protein